MGSKLFNIKDVRATEKRGKKKTMLEKKEELQKETPTNVTWKFN
jgi:hypothetical protein